MGKEKKEKKTKNVKKGKQFSFKKIYTPETISTYFELRQRNQENNNRCKQEINQLEEECLGSPSNFWQWSNQSRRQTFPIPSNSKMNEHTSKIPIPKPLIRSNSVSSAFSSFQKVAQQSECRTQTVDGFKEVPKIAQQSESRTQAVNGFKEIPKVAQQSESRSQPVNGFKEDVFTQVLMPNYDITTFNTNNETIPIVSSVLPFQVNFTNSFNSNHSIFNIDPHASVAYELATSNAVPLIRLNNSSNENVIVDEQVFNNCQIVDMSQAFDNYYPMDTMQPSECNFSDSLPLLPIRRF
ncbi:hypothetical protein F8M41_020154 [Gigaspora margarita]|uniref:Uncharacterized protein n=1 Tax=Gigaspora margarita TaxID=4874 RepID=A0A8H4AIY4_GIGMA|nr:hypothetical protein F8M41_020154 [Gigaspora margarita]